MSVSDEMYRRVVEAVPEGIWVVDPQGHTIFSNQRMAEILGVNFATMSGQSCFECVFPDELVDAQRHFARTLAGDRRPFEFRLRRADGSPIWVSISCMAMCDDSDARVGLLGLFSDISERKRAEAELRESEERFRNMADTAPVMIWVTGRDKLFTFFNKTWLDFTGSARNGEPETGWSMGMHPDDLDQCIASYYSAFDVRRSFHMEFRRRRADGEYRWLQCSGVPRFTAGGDFEGYIGSEIDITDVKRALQEVVVNQALRESEEKYHRIVETMTEGVWILDHEGQTTFVNRQMAAMLGYQVEEMVGRSVLDFKDEEARRIALQKLERRRRGITEQYDSTFQTRDGRRLTVLISTRPLWDGDGRYAGTLGVITNITERSVLEERLHQAFKMEAIGRLAGGVAHDFNNLLTVINGYSDLLLRKLSAADPLHAGLTEIRSAGQRAQELTGQMLAFSRRRNRATETLSLRSVIEEVENMFRRIIGEGIHLITAFDPALGQVRADRTELTQILLNLAVNARDAMPTGGTLTFETRNVDVDEDYARNYPAARAGAYVLLMVSDTGVGMDAETQQHLFEPFFTTKQAGKGTGLGLATVYGIVSQRGGWIQVHSKPREGATFWIYLPRLNAVPSEEEAHSEPQRQQFRGTETILVVEDQPQVRELTCSILREFGYQVLEASDAMEALSLAETHAGPLHLLLTDVIMPGMHGLELATRLQVIRGTPVLFMSGYPGSMEAGLDSEVDYIQKPFTPDILVGKVQEILGAADTMRRSEGKSNFRCRSLTAGTDGARCVICRRFHAYLGDVWTAGRHDPHRPAPEFRQTPPTPCLWQRQTPRRRRRYRCRSC